MISIKRTRILFALQKELPLIKQKLGLISIHCQKQSLLGSMTYLQFSHYASSSKRNKKDLKLDSGNKSSKQEDLLNKASQYNYELRVAELLNDGSSKSLIRRAKRPYVVDIETAKSITYAVLKHRTIKYAPILEIEPGVGVLTRELLNSGVNKVLAVQQTYATDNIFVPLMLEVQQEFSEERLEVFNLSILSNWMKYKSDGSIAQKYLEMEELLYDRMECAALEHGRPFSVILLGYNNSGDNSLFHFVEQRIAREDKLLSQRNIEFFFLMSPNTKMALQNLKDWDWSTAKFHTKSSTLILIYLFYDIEIIDKFHLEDFWPPSKPKKYKTKPFKDLDMSLRYLSKMKLKDNMSSLLPLSQRISFHLFLKQFYFSARKRVIPFLEKMVPGCGLRMLHMGFTMSEMVRDVHPQRLLELYKAMLEWPEYINSPLQTHIEEKTYQKLEECEEDDVEIESMKDDYEEGLDEEDDTYKNKL